MTVRTWLARVAQPYKGSLRRKIITWSFVPTAFILAAVAWVNYVAYQQVTEDLVVSRNQELTRFSASEFAAGLTDYTALLAEYAGLFASLPQVAQAYEGDLVVQADILERARGRLQVFDGGVLILTNQGRVVATEPKRPEIMGQDWSNREYFRQMLRTPGSVFSDIVPDGQQGLDVIVVALPITGDQGQFLGVIAGMLRLDRSAANFLYRDLARLGAGRSGDTYLLDGSGRIIYHSDAERIGEDVSGQAIARLVLRGQVGAVRTRDLQGRPIVASFAPVPSTSWSLVGEEAWAALTQGGRGYQRFLLLLLVLGVIVPALVVSVGVQRITRPIRDLIDAAQRVAGGNFGQTITANTGDEIQELALQFNRMAAELRESYAHLERTVAARTEELATLNAVASVVSESLDLDQVLDDALNKSLEAINVEAGGIYLLDSEHGILTVAVHRGLSSDFVEEIDKLPLGEGFSGRVAELGQPLVVPDVSTDARLTRTGARDAGFHSLASVPLSSKGKVLGTLFAATRGYREFTAQDIQLLTSIGNQVGIAIENTRLFREADRRMQELEALYQADERMHRHLELDQVLQALVDVAVDLLSADKSGVFEWTPNRERLVMGVARGFSPESMAQLSFARGEGITGWVAAHGEPVVVADALTDPRRANERPATLKAVDDEGVRSFMHIPIKIEDKVFGVFNVSFTRVRALGENEQRLFVALAQRAALAIENAQLYEQTEELAVVRERSRLARELHDAVTQTLFSASLIAEILPDLWESDPQEGRQLLMELRQLSRGALAEMRTLLLELRPAALVEANLVDLIRQLAETVTGREGVSVELQLMELCELSPDVHVAFYRIAQEALNNVVKHAQARHVTVSLRCNQRKGHRPEQGRAGSEDAVELCIVDDGCGFELGDAPPDRLGLSIIRERAQAIGAQLSIESQVGCGTQVRVVWDPTASPVHEPSVA